MLTPRTTNATLLFPILRLNTSEAVILICRYFIILSDAVFEVRVGSLVSTRMRSFDFYLEEVRSNEEG